MRLLFITIGLLLVACSSQPQRSLESQQSVPVDFNGSWEMDYGRSDDVNERLGSIYRELQRQAERQARKGNNNSAMLSNTVNLNQRMAGFVNLARFADMVSESQVLTIEQSERDISVDREGDFALNCGFYTDSPELQREELGVEMCGWDGQQMIFHLVLSDGTVVTHRMSIAPDGERLHIATTVAAGGAPFTLNRFYYRFEPLPEDYSCEYTLSKGQVCTRNSS